MASDRYSYRQLDDYTDLIQRTLQRLPIVAKVQRAGVLPEQIYLEYSAQRVASFGLQPSKIKDVLSARNITAPGGQSWKHKRETCGSTRQRNLKTRRRSGTCWSEHRQPESRFIYATSSTFRAATRAPRVT